MKIYVASSWRNKTQDAVVTMLRALGHEVYDFKNPPGGTGFSWSHLDENWRNWTPEQFQQALNHPISEKGFNSDFNAMKWADCCVMVLPCGRSAHTEAGWMAGAGKKVIVFMPQREEPELMYKIYDHIATSFEELEMYLKCNKCALCGVPLDVHGTSCRWENASAICNEDGYIVDKRHPGYGKYPSEYFSRLRDFGNLM